MAGEKTQDYATGQFDKNHFGYRNGSYRRCMVSTNGSAIFSSSTPTMNRRGWTIPAGRIRNSYLVAPDEEVAAGGGG